MLGWERIFFDVMDHSHDTICDKDHIFFLKSTRGERWSAEAETGRVVGRTRLVRNGVFVGGHVGNVHGVLELAP